MSLSGLLTFLGDDPQLHVVTRMGSETSTAPGAAEPAGKDLVAPPTLRPVLVAALARAAGFVLAVTATAREAEDLAAGLGSFLSPDSVAYFPGWETLPHERLSPRSDTVGQRLAVRRRLPHPAPPGEPNGPLTGLVSPGRGRRQPSGAGAG